jgi:hypothetical protein
MISTESYSFVQTYKLSISLTQATFFFYQNYGMDISNYRLSQIKIQISVNQHLRAKTGLAAQCTHENFFSSISDLRYLLGQKLVKIYWHAKSRFWDTFVLGQNLASRGEILPRHKIAQYLVVQYNFSWTRSETYTQNVHLIKMIKKKLEIRDFL